jgi:hypothetical protein
VEGKGDICKLPNLVNFGLASSWTLDFLRAADTILVLVVVIVMLPTLLNLSNKIMFSLLERIIMSLKLQPFLVWPIKLDIFFSQREKNKIDLGQQGGLIWKIILMMMCSLSFRHTAACIVDFQ